MRIESLGRMAHFYIPASRWCNPTLKYKGKTINVLVREFLIENYNGFTIRGPFIGVWRNSNFEDSIEEAVIEVKVSFKGKERIPKLQKFLVKLCKLMKEKCLYLETGEDSWLVHPD